MVEQYEGAWPNPFWGGHGPPLKTKLGWKHDQTRDSVDWGLGDTEMLYMDNWTSIRVRTCVSCTVYT
jgi:hypothetical protein